MHRGPQAQTQPVAAAPYPAAAFHHAPNAALLIDFDNVTMGIRSDLGKELRNLLSSDIIKGKVAVQRAYADWRRYPQYIVPLAESSIDMIYAPAYGSSKKNATDIRLAIDALELVFTRPEIGTYILLSGDSDFSSLVIKLKEYGKYVIGVGIRESSSDLLVMNCDEYYSYNALAGLVKTGDEEAAGPPRKWDPWELVSEAIGRMKRNGDVMRSDRLKQVMQDVDPSFDEGNLGIAKFSRFVQEASQRGLVTVTRLENGQLEVSPPGDGGAAAGREATAIPRDSGAARGPGDLALEGVGEEVRPARRGRRGRGGRGREDRAGRAARPLRDASPAAVPAEPGAVPVEPSAGADVAPPSEDAAARPRTDVLVQRTVRADDAGTSGERLTRDEAFDLVRRAVTAVTRSGEDAARASDVRRKAREVLGRDSESLSERNFTRILRDAHDADVIDLRRRGDDFEVARAVEQIPVGEQLRDLDAADRTAAAASMPAAAPPRRGLGPRGIPGRGRGAGTGRLSTLPPELLSVGRVDVALPPVAVPAERPAPISGTGREMQLPAAAAAAAAESVKGATPAGRRGRKRVTKRAAPSAGGSAPPPKPRRPRAKKATREGPEG